MLRYAAIVQKLWDLLRVLRVLRWTHLLWRYSVCWGLMAIKGTCADRIAPIHDADPADHNALFYLASENESAEVAQFLRDRGANSNPPCSSRGTITHPCLIELVYVRIDKSTSQWYVYCPMG